MMSPKEGEGLIATTKDEIRMDRKKHLIWIKGSVTGTSIPLVIYILGALKNWYILKYMPHLTTGQFDFLPSIEERSFMLGFSLAMLICFALFVVMREKR